MLVDIEARSVDRTRNEEQEAQKSNLRTIAIKHIHDNTVAKRDEKADQACECLTEGCKHDGEDSQGQHALA